MDEFERKRKDVLGYIGKMKAEKKRHRMASKSAAMQAVAPAPRNEGDKSPVAVVSGQELFLRNITSIVEAHRTTYRFAKINEAVDACADKKITNVVFDCDHPGGISAALDIYGNLKSVQPGTHFVFCTQDLSGNVAEVIREKGEILLEKPVNVTELLSALNIK